MEVTGLTKLDILYVIAGGDGRTGSEVGERIRELHSENFSMSGIYKNLTELESEGYIRREQKKGQGKANYITERGVKQLREYERWHLQDYQRGDYDMFPFDHSDDPVFESVQLFPEYRNIALDFPTRPTIERLDRFATLRDSTQEGHIYELTQESIWHSPYLSLEDLLRDFHAIVDTTDSSATAWIEEQWRNHREQFTLKTHPEGYTILSAADPATMETVVRANSELQATLYEDLSDSESIVLSGTELQIKRSLYDAGYPVSDSRLPNANASVDVKSTVSLSEQQTTWEDEIQTKRNGIIIGFDDSGLRRTAVSILADSSYETLILTADEDRTTEWISDLTAQTTLTRSQVGIFSEDSEAANPVTIATHREGVLRLLPDAQRDSRWGLLIIDDLTEANPTFFDHLKEAQTIRRIGLASKQLADTDIARKASVYIGHVVGTDWSTIPDAESEETNPAADSSTNSENEDGSS